MKKTIRIKIRKLAKKNKFIYNILSEFYILQKAVRSREHGGNEVLMFNMNNKKSRRRISAIIIAILVLAMIIPTVAYFI